MDSSKQIRTPAVAGAFYAGSATALRRQIEGCFEHPLGPGSLPRLQEAPRHILGLVSPHAGYMYSGPVAAHGFSRLASESPPRLVVILGPKHHRAGARVAISGASSWQTPLGSVSVDTEAVDRIVAASKLIEVDDAAHRQEHSLEVQLPFLQYVYGERLRIVAIVMESQDHHTSQEVGQTLASVLKPEDTLIVASTDFTHYEPHSTASKKDALALEAIARMDAAGLEEVVYRQGITMCGPGPVMAMLTAAKQWGALQARLLCYATSGDITGDRSAVVGYASVEVSR